MAATTLSNIDFQDEAFLDFVAAQIPDKVEFLTSGILVQNNDSMITNQVGQFANIPNYNKIDGDVERLTAATDLTVNALTTYKDRGVWLEIGKAWGAEDWTRWVTGADPMGEIASQVTNYFSRQLQTIYLNHLTGIFGSALSSSHSTGATYSGAKIDEDAVAGAKLKLGDNMSKLQRGILNSKVLQDAVNRKIANYDLAGDTFQSGNIASLMGMNVFADDGLTATASVYPSYFAAPGASFYSIREFNLDTDKDILKAGGTEYLRLRASVLIHTPGVQYNSSTVNPTNAQLATSGNWTKVAENKNIPIVQLKTL